MTYLLSVLLGGLILLGSHFSLPPLNFNPSLAALPIVRDIFAGNIPENLGLKEGHLAPCPSSPNCVVSQAGDVTHTIDPIVYQSDRSSAQETLIKVLSVVPGTHIIEQTEDYIRAESASKIMGFIDDLEFYFPKDETLIHVRSASRLGESDLGVNRRRIEQIRLALQDLQA